jgi:hypothetical protein
MEESDDDSETETETDTESEVIVAGNEYGTTGEFRD